MTELHTEAQNRTSNSNQSVHVSVIDYIILNALSLDFALVFSNNLYLLLVFKMNINF